MHEKLLQAFDRELASARRAESEDDAARAWFHLECAHVLSQAYAWPHVRVHGRMFALAWRRRDRRELAGQLPRLALAAPGSWTGRAPRGNTGGADVGIFTPMDVPDELERLLRPEPTAADAPGPQPS
jgi:Protein of unknown function (DUF3703)